VYTHGHVDHVGGSGAFIADARDNGRPEPTIIGHENVPIRMDRYDRTNGYNQTINRRQFGGVRNLDTAMGFNNVGGGAARPDRFLDPEVARPSITFADRLSTQVGGLEIEMHHDKGETDDHLWAWIPERKALCTGDFLIWNFPNAGNPQKVQRYPLEWAHAMRKMAAPGAELLLPAHGLPIAGRDRIATVLGDVATVLEDLVADTLEMMNAGETLDTIVHSVTVDPEMLAKPYLRPMYDEPEFIVHNVWRIYGGWYDGNPANLKPAPQSAVAAEVAALSGGGGALAARARELADAGDMRLACQIVEMAAMAEPDDAEIHRARADIYAARRKLETSLMAKGIYGSAARESAAIAGPEEG
jgi:alkyl sulfatase BDS1-like metallo-beta-lactamase superfamily hydrolase